MTRPRNRPHTQNIGGSLIGRRRSSCTIIGIAKIDQTSGAMPSAHHSGYPSSSAASGHAVGSRRQRQCARGPLAGRAGSADRQLGGGHDETTLVPGGASRTHVRPGSSPTGREPAVYTVTVPGNVRDHERLAPC